MTEIPKNIFYCIFTLYIIKCSFKAVLINILIVIGLFFKATKYYNK